VLGFTDEYKEGETKCNGEDAELSVRAWGSYTDTDAGSRYIANMDRIHIDNNGMVFGIYFTPKDADQPMPPWSSELPALGAVDAGQVAPATSVPGSVAGSSVPGTTTAGSSPVTTAPAATAPTNTESTAPPTTTSG
jgi:hypothetical protein